ncbi:MAG: aminotransferase class V-fold PLP-dependent enzyme [Alphaproteobacteria bacterium]|nr:aminotransferase class V-fold PLP-dependent enzyme [Alphaproteobacteria bacterium]
MTDDAAPRAPSLAEARDQFPAAQRWTYVNVPSRGVISKASRAAIDDVADAQLSGEEIKDEYGPALQRVRASFAKLIGAKPHEIAVTKNVSEGLNAIGTAMDWKPGDNVVLCTELEHPNNVYLWMNLAARGVEVRGVKSRDGMIDAATIAAAIDKRTRIVSVSTVTFTPGYRTDVEAIGKAAKKAGALLLVDAVQSAGVLAIDVEALGIDALATSTSKGLLGVMGTGLLYVSDRWVERLNPAWVARFSVVTGKHESDLGDGVLRLQPDARRFEIGNYNWIGIAALDASLDLLLSIGVPAIEHHATALAARLAGGLEQLGYPVCRPPEPWARSHIVTIGQLGAGDAYTSNDERLNRFAKALGDAKVKFTVRRGLVRFGFHLYNNEADVDKLLDIARASAR